MSTSFQELGHSPRIALNEGRVTAQRTFLIAWSDWPAFVAELYGSYTVVDELSVYTPPAHFPGQPDLVVQKIAVEPLPGDRPLTAPLTDLSAGTNLYPSAKVTADYEYVIDNNRPGFGTRGRLPTVPNGTYLELESDLAAEYLSAPGRYWRFRGAPTQRVPDDTHVGLLRACEDLHIRWRRVPMPPFDTIRAKRGSVNVGEFLGLAGGTVLFFGARVRRDFQLIDTGLWRIDYHFKVREPGWNEIFQPGGGGWQTIEDDSGALPYDETDFDALFAFGS